MNRDDLFFTISDVRPYLILQNKKQIPIDAINKPQKGIVVYTKAYWDHTLTKHATYEIVVKNNKVISINRDGNSPITKDSFIVSISQDVDNKLYFIKPGMHLRYKYDIDNIKNIDSNTNIVSGSHILQNGEFLPNYNSAFVNNPHARTAICKLKDNKIGIFIVNHNLENIQNLTVRDIYQSIKDMKYRKEQILAMPLKNILSIYQKSKKEGDIINIGMNLEQLSLMLENQGCISDINLDEDSSSSLVYKDKSKVVLSNSFKEFKSISPNQKNLFPDISNAILVFEK